MRSWHVVVPSGLAAAAAILFDVGGSLQIALACWFLLTCPALGYVRMLRLADVELEIALTVGLGLSIDVAVGLVLVVAGVYAPLLALGLITAIAMIGALAEARQGFNTASVTGARRTKPARAAGVTSGRRES